MIEILLNPPTSKTKFHKTFPENIHLNLAQIPPLNSCWNKRLIKSHNSKSIIPKKNTFTVVYKCIPPLSAKEPCNYYSQLISLNNHQTVVVISSLQRLMKSEINSFLWQQNFLLAKKVFHHSKWIWYARRKKKFFFSVMVIKISGNPIRKWEIMKTRLHIFHVFFLIFIYSLVILINW